MESHLGVMVVRLSEVRRCLVAERSALRLAQDRLTVARARAEHKAIAGTGGNDGKNAEDRERFLAVVLEENADYTLARSQVRELTTSIEEFEAERDALLDARRDREWAIRERIVSVLADRSDAGELVDVVLDQIETAHN